MRNFTIWLVLALLAATAAIHVNVKLDDDMPFAGLGLLMIFALSGLGSLALATVSGLFTKYDARTWVAGSQVLLATFFGVLFQYDEPSFTLWLLGYAGLLLLGIGWASRKPKAPKAPAA